MIYDKYMFTVGGNVATLYNQTTATQSHGIPRNKPLFIIKYDANANNQAAFDGICCDVDDDLDTTHDYVYYSTAFSLNPDITTLTAADSYHLDKSVYQEVENGLFTVTNNGLTFPVRPYEHWSNSELYGYVIPKSAYSAQDLYVYAYEKDISETIPDYEFWIYSGGEHVPVSGCNLYWTVTQSGNNSAAVCFSRNSYNSQTAPIDRKYKFERLDWMSYTNITAIENTYNAYSSYYGDHENHYYVTSPGSTSSVTFYNEITEQTETSSVRVYNTDTFNIDHISNTHAGRFDLTANTHINTISATSALFNCNYPLLVYYNEFVKSGSAIVHVVKWVPLYNTATNQCVVDECIDSVINAGCMQVNSVRNSTLKQSTYIARSQPHNMLPRFIDNSTVEFSSNFNNVDVSNCNLKDSTLTLIKYPEHIDLASVTLTNLTANNSYINGTYYAAYTGDLTVNL